MLPDLINVCASLGSWHFYDFKKKTVFKNLLVKFGE